MATDVVEMAVTAEAQPPAWHPNPAGPGLRYWDGQRWSESYHPGITESDPAISKEAIWALSLGFAVAGGVPAATGMPVLGFYFPLGLGGAGLALAIVAFTSGRGGTPWYAAIAVIVAIIAVVAGVDGLNQFTEPSNALSNFGD